MSTRRPAFSLFLLVAAIIGTGIYAMALILRIATGGYPPLWGWFALCAAAGAAGAIGAWSGSSRAAHE